MSKAHFHAAEMLRAKTLTFFKNRLSKDKIVPQAHDSCWLQGAKLKAAESYRMAVSLGQAKVNLTGGGECCRFLEGFGQSWI